MTGGPGGAARRGRALYGREALAGLRARERVGPRGSGPRGQAGRPERGEGVGLRDGPLRRLGQAGSGLGFILGLVFLFWVGLVFFSISFPIQTNSTNIYLNSKLNLNSTLTLKQIKQMHQHECNNNFLNLDKF